MTFVNIQTTARRLIAAEAIQTCQTCAVDKADIGATAPILPSWRQAWRITCPVCHSQLGAAGQGSAANGEDGSHSLASWEDALKGERLLDDYAERGIQTWASPIDVLRLLLIRRDPKPIDPENWIETPKILDLLVPGFDRVASAAAIPIPPADRPILPLLLRPALLAGIAIVERLGPKIVTELHGRTMGGLPHSFRNHRRRNSRTPPARPLSLIYAAQLRFKPSGNSYLTAVVPPNWRSLTFKCSATLSS